MATTENITSSSDDVPDAPEVTIPHRVVVFGVPDDPHDLRDLLVAQLKLSATDAQIQVHSLPGLLLAQLNTDAAAKLAAAIRELGANAMAIPNSEVPDLDHLILVHHVRCLAEGLELVDERNHRDALIGWNDVVLISIGVVPQRTRLHTDPSPMSFVKASPYKRDVDTDTSLLSGPEALIVAVNPFRAIRIDHGEMNYEYLGDRMKSSATTNFRQLAQDLVAAAPDAYRTPATRAFLERGFLRHYQFRSCDEHTQYALFHLLVRNSSGNPRPIHDA